MKLYNHILKTINWLIAVALGTMAFLWLSRLIDASVIANFIIGVFQLNSWVNFTILAVSVYLVLFNILYLVAPLFNPRYASYIKIDMPTGNFAISVSAIEHSLKRSVKKLPDVHDVTIRLYKEIKGENKPIRLVVHCSTWEGANVKEVTEKVREIINLRFQEIIDVKQPPVFQIVISHIEEREIKKPESKKKAVAAERPMFYGPEYPIDSEL